MNKKDYEKLSFIVAELEWASQGGSSSECVGRAAGARKILENFTIPTETLLFARVWVISQLAEVTDELEFDTLVEWTENNGYDNLCEIIEDCGFTAVKKLINNS